ncbi:hypothetical protein L9F63_000168, partial [Diploptera punctata]
ANTINIGPTGFGVQNRRSVKVATIKENPEPGLRQLARVNSLILPGNSHDNRTCATKELPTTRWRRERRCKERNGDYTKNKTNHD